MHDDSPFEFPCTFSIKVMGDNDVGFENEIVMIARQHVTNLGEGAVRSTPSRTAKFLSVTITFAAESREQLDALYRAMHVHPKVKMVL